jgi:H+/Cl- antiporter ClcA
MLCPGRFASKLCAMNESSSRHFGRTALAALIMLVAVWVLLKIVVGIVAALFVPIVVIGAIVAVVWAYRVLF